MDVDPAGQAFWSLRPQTSAASAITYIQDHSLQVHQYALFLNGIEGPLPRRGPQHLAAALDASIPLHAHISEARYTRDNSLLLKTNSIQCALQVAQLESLLSVPIRVTLDYNTLSRKVLLRGVDVDLSLEEISSQLQYRGHFPLMLRRFSRLEGGTRCPTTTVLVSFLADIPPTDVAIYYSIYRCDVFHDRPSICRNCKRYGHSKARCRSAFRCGRCSKFHPGGDCDSQVLTCPGCAGSHEATDPSCPRYSDAAKVLAFQEANRCSYQDASRRVLPRSSASTPPAHLPPPSPPQPPPPPLSPHRSRPSSHHSSAPVPCPSFPPFDTTEFFADIRHSLELIKAQVLADLTTSIKEIVTAAMSHRTLSHMSSPPSPPRKVSLTRASTPSAASLAHATLHSASAVSARSQRSTKVATPGSKSAPSHSLDALPNKFDRIKTSRRSGSLASS